MRIGYLLDTHHGEYEQPYPTASHASAVMDSIINEGLLAEKAGFHGLQVPDRHGRTETYFPGTSQLLTILGRETSKIAIGAFACVATLYQPLEIAEQYAVIDNLSRGRLFTGLARGYHSGYWGQFGIPQEKLLGRFKEFLAIWDLAFRRERFDFRGKHYTVEQGLLTPGPYQQPRWPIWGGGTVVQAAIARAAEFADCWACDDYPLDVPTWRQRYETYTTRTRELNKAPFIVVMRNGWVGDSWEEAATTFGEHAAEELRFYFRQGIFVHPDFPSESSITPKAIAPHQIFGSPQQCVERLEQYHEEFKVDYFTIRLRMPRGPSLQETAEQIMRFGEEVVQPIHKKYPPLTHAAIPQGCRW